MSKKVSRDLSIRLKPGEVLWIFLAVAGLCLGLCAVTAVKMESETHKYWKLKTIEKGFAEYNRITGEWQWKEEEKSNAEND